MEGEAGQARLLTLLQFPTRQDEHGLREHLLAGTGLLAAAQCRSVPVLQRTLRQIAPTPQVAEHCKEKAAPKAAGGSLGSRPPPREQEGAGGTGLGRGEAGIHPSLWRLL